MTKNELQKIIIESIKLAIIKEIKPLIKKTIREEFYKIVEEAETYQTELKNERNDMSMINLLKNNQDEDETRQQVEEKLFSGGRFADILNQTANQYRGRSISDESVESLMNEQMEFKLNSNNINSNVRYDRSQLASKIGYGDGFKKVGSGIKIPDIEEHKISTLQNILNKEERRSEEPSTVLLPTKNANGVPIDFNKIPEKVIKNMIKDYSSVLKKMESRSSFVRGGSVGKIKNSTITSVDAFNNMKSQFQFEEDKK